MPTDLEYEMKQSTMLRGISLDIRRRYEDIMKQLHDDVTKKEEDFIASCAEWSIIIGDFVSDLDDMGDLLALIESYKDKKIDMWMDYDWRLLMRMELPKYFRKRMESFTQVPKLASMCSAPPPIVRYDDDSW